jgi:nicotinate-nucleotide--dimethylbenzimidazole phosphoribosyltransferase
MIATNLMEETQRRLDNLTKPRGSLGRLEELAKWVVGVTGKENPSMKEKVIFTLAADHGVTAEGVSAYPSEVTAQMVLNFLSGGAGINVLARHVGARVIVADIGVAGDLPPHPGLKSVKIARGTRNMAKGPAMTDAEARRSIEAGRELLREQADLGADIVGIGEMGIGNTTAAAALTAVFTGRSPEEVTGRGTGVDDKTWEKKVRAIQEAIRVNRPDQSDPLGVLARVGGFEIGGMAGIILEASARRIPVVLDGFISGAAALVACRMESGARDVLVAGHRSAEKGHKVLLDHLALRPLLELDFRLGEGTGAALAISLVEAAVKVLTQMATFEKANVSGKIPE